MKAVDYASSAAPRKPLGGGQSDSRAPEPGGPPLTLADEHALLLEQVAIRADDLLAATAHDRWPDRELRRLLGYIRTEVLGQARDEEMLLFTPRPASPDLARLERDHARLREATEVLENAADGEDTWSAARLATTTRDLICQLERHLVAEERLLAAGGGPGRVEAVTRPGGRLHEWYPLTEGPGIDMDALPPDQVIDAVTDRLLRLRRGEQVELCYGSDPCLVWRRMDDISPSGYRFTYVEDGPDRWRVQVTRRPTASDARESPR